MIFESSKQVFAKKNLVPGATESRNVCGKVCRNKTDNCSTVFFFLWWPELSALNYPIIKSYVKIKLSFFISLYICIL